MIQAGLTSFIVFLLLACSSSTSTHSVHTTQEVQTSPKDIAVGGPCDRCDLMFEGMPAIDKIGSETTIASADEPGERMLLNGTVLKKDGAAAKDVVLYIYHTNAKGYYAPADKQTLGKMNGHLRNWVKTDASGKFIIHSIRPAPYPNRNVPAHIHIVVKEPGKTRYYIDEVWFDDDPLITSELRKKAEKRGGDLIIHLSKNTGGIWVGDLKITLGLNIPEYK